MLLHSKAPIKEGEMDGFQWDSTGTNYTVRAGHQHLYNNTFQMSLWNHWKIVWQTEASSKIKNIYMDFAERQNLNSRKFKKKRHQRPSRCPNYCKAEEMMHHFFIEFPFVVYYWEKMSSTGNLNWEPQHTIAETI